jgi:hypothetical protein
MIEDTFYAMACATILSAFIIFLAGYFSWWLSKRLTKKATASKGTRMLNNKTTYLRQEYLNNRHQGMR